MPLNCAFRFPIGRRGVSSFGETVHGFATAV